MAASRFLSKGSETTTCRLRIWFPPPPPGSVETSAAPASTVLHGDGTDSITSTTRPLCMNLCPWSRWLRVMGLWAGEDDEVVVIPRLSRMMTAATFWVNPDALLLLRMMWLFLVVFNGLANGSDNGEGHGLESNVGSHSVITIARVQNWGLECQTLSLFPGYGLNTDPCHESQI